MAYTISLSKTYYHTRCRLARNKHTYSRRYVLHHRDQNGNYIRRNRRWSNNYYENVRLERYEVTIKELLKYCIPPRSLLSYGYPVEYSKNRKLSIIYGTPKPDPCNTNEDRWAPNETAYILDYRAPHFYGAVDKYGCCGYISNVYLYPFPPPQFNPVWYNVTYHIRKSEKIVIKNCVRCKTNYSTYKQSGEPVMKENCLYHWGKLKNLYYQPLKLYICCGRPVGSIGCTQAEMHVWDGLLRGKYNGPYRGFVRTRPRPLGFSRAWIATNSVLGLDCEMCFTLNGFEACKVTIVNVNGDLVYSSYIRPNNRIIDYNTRFSRVCEIDLNVNIPNRTINVRSLKEVQADLMRFVHCETIIVGHGLENDLRVLKIVHKRIIDTAVVFPHYYGLPYRRSLKSLASHYLDRKIQGEINGHDSKEDAKTCLDLMLWKINADKST